MGFELWGSAHFLAPFPFLQAVSQLGTEHQCSEELDDALTIPG